MNMFRSMHDVLNFAIQKEIEAHDFYSRLSHDAARHESRQKLQSIAADEFQHRIHLEAVRDGKAQFRKREVGSLDLVDTISDVQTGAHLSYVELLALAIKQEQAAFQLYTKLADTTPDRTIKELFELLAQEEKEHKLGLEIEYDLASF